MCKRGVLCCNHVENIYNLGTKNFLFITFDAELLVTQGTKTVVNINSWVEERRLSNLMKIKFG